MSTKEGPYEFMYFPMRNRQIVRAKRILNVDTKRGMTLDNHEVLISYVDDVGIKRQVLITEEREEK